LSLDFAWFILALLFAVPLLLGRCSWDVASRIIPGTRGYLLSQLEQGRIPDWNTAKRCWLRANAVYEGPVGYGSELTPEYLLIVAIAKDVALPSEQLLAAVSAERPILTAYCISTLRHRREMELLKSLPADVLESKAKLVSRVGCIGVEVELRDFARQRMGQLDRTVDSA